MCRHVYVQLTYAWGEGYKIERTEKPHIGKVIRHIREQKGMSQETLARDALFNRTTLSYIEQGKHECNEETLRAIRKVLGVVDLPLYEAERMAYKDALYKWYAIISERKLEEADELRAKYSIIKLLPQDKELNVLFSLFECRLLLGLGELVKAKEILDAFVVDVFSDTQLYHYYYNQGTYNIKNKLYQEALNFYLKAYELMKFGFEKDVTLYYNISICYDRLGFISRSVTFLEEACKLNTHIQNSVSMFSLYTSLGARYASLGVLQRSKIFLDKALSIANSDHNTNDNKNTKARVGMVIANYGFMYRMAKEWRRAIEHLDKAVIYFGNDNPLYVEALYQKARVLIEMGDALSCTSLLADGVSLSKGDDDYTMLFAALETLVNPNDSSAKHLETIILPYLREKKLNIVALDYSMFLRDYYENRGKGFKSRVYAMLYTICNIRDEIYEGGVIS